MTKISKEDLYEILQIKKDATLDEIKSAYRKLARLHHPDIDSTKDGLEAFKKIRKAYDILSNSYKKKIYDLNHGFNQKTEKEDIIEDNKDIKPETKEDVQTSGKSFSQVLSDIIDGIFVYVKKVSGTKNKETDDIFANVTISSKEALVGTYRVINIVQTALCPNCLGKKFINEALCPLCKGTGEISSHKKINAKIPPNTKNGDKVKVEGAGNKSSNGEKDGDLYLIIKIDEKSLFTVKDNIVYMDLPISTFEAALGANIQIPTFYDDITIKIPPYTSSGQRFRLKGQGIFDKETGEKGDMIVTAIIKLPKNLSSKEIELYKELMENNTYDVREGLRNNE